MSNDYKHTDGSDYATQERQGQGQEWQQGQHWQQGQRIHVSLADQAYAAEQQCKSSGLAGRTTNKPMDRGLRQEAMEILGMIHSLESSISGLRTQLFGSFPESGEYGKTEREPSLSETLAQSRIALGRLLDEVNLLRSKSE